MVIAALLVGFALGIAVTVAVILERFGEILD